MFNLNNNEPGHIAQIVDGDLTTIFYCYPSRSGISLADRAWKIKRMRIFSNPDGEMERTDYMYPDGSTSYDYAPDEMLNYNYQYTNNV